MQGCWVMDCNRCVFLSHPSTRCQSLSIKQTHIIPNLPFSTGFYSNWVWEWLGMAIAVFLFLTWMDVRLAVRPAAQYQTGTSWNGVSFRLLPGSLLWLKSRRTRDTWKKQQLIRQETYTPIPKQAHAEEKLTCLYTLFFPTLGKKRVISRNIHHTSVQPLIKMGTSLAKFVSNNGVVCV